MQAFSIRLVCALALFLACCGHALAQEGDPSVDRVIALAKDTALNSERVDWPVVERDAAALFRATPGQEGRTAAIRRVLMSLDDGHSFYMPPRMDPAGAGSSAAGSQQRVRAPIASSDTVAGRFGRLTINAWVGAPQAVIGAAQLVRQELVKALGAESCGLIVDVSSNGGGNMWPMMGGIAPLYDEGTLQTFEGRGGARQVVNVQGGALRMDTSVYPRVDYPAFAVTPRFIAIIIGKRTASSGEILALGFKGQGNVRTFGQATAGLTTANKTTRLPDGGLLGLTTSRILDRAGNVQEGVLLPDEPSERPNEAAAAWLAERCETNREKGSASLFKNRGQSALLR